MINQTLPFPVDGNDETWYWLYRINQLGAGKDITFFELQTWIEKAESIRATREQQALWEATNPDPANGLQAGVDY